MLNAKDKVQIKALGMTEDAVMQQLHRFETGFPFLKIKAVGTIGNGIKRLNDKELKKCINSWKDFQKSGGKIQKFVPASGAASRMFKDMFAFVASGNAEPTTDFEKHFFENIDNFAFCAALNKCCKSLYGKDIHALMEAKRHADIAKTMLSKEGLNYGFLPKALLQFHKVAAGGVHTALEEHLEEGAQYATDKNRTVNLHFTVSPEHKPLVEKLLAEKVAHYQKVWGVTYNITLSEQKTSTNTIAVNADNTPYHNADGELLLRPAGHGALIENLNEQDADVVFIKNIDNVVPSKLRHSTTRYKKVIGGYLVQIQQRIEKYLTELAQKDYTHKSLQDMLKFLETTLNTNNAATQELDDEKLATYLTHKFNRPIRVCGMVKNEGEPGGGPYLAYDKDGSCSPQILESAQINADDPATVQLMNSGTHFNPVDLVCYLKDFQGNSFDLKKHIDADTGLISQKSVNGVEIKALELPGLWNGAMSDWNTVFVEVPIDTFNPVKTVNDLLRNSHQ